MIESSTRAGVQVLRLEHRAMLPELMDALADRVCAATQPVVLTGSGRVFCLGADLNWIASNRDPALAVAMLVARHHAAVRAIVSAQVPVIAAINGSAAGGGLSLALAADYRVASTSATCTAAYFGLNLPPDGGTSVFLPRLIGTARSLELLLTNRTLPAPEAHAWGLVNEVVPDDEVLDRACQLAGEMPRVPPGTLLATRRLLDTGSGAGLDSQLQREAVAMRSAARQPAFRAALRAFLERSRHSS